MEIIANFITLILQYYNIQSKRDKKIGHILRHASLLKTIIEGYTLEEEDQGRNT